MSGFILTQNIPANQHVLAEAKNAFKNKSYHLKEQQVDIGLYTLTYYEDLYRNKCNIYQHECGDIFYYAGFLSYNSKHGKNALIAIKEDLDKKVALQNMELHGNFLLIAYYNGSLNIVRDLFGTYGCYTNNEKTWFTSSATAAMFLNKKKVFNKLNLFENILFGMEFGLETLVEGVYLLDATEVHLPETNTTVKRKITIPPVEYNYQKCLRNNADKLIEEFRIYHSLFGSSITSALSGGFDSRLMLAAEMQCGIVPHLYVYGLPKDKDVLVAKNICTNENIELFHSERFVEKTVDADTAGKTILQNFWDFDGNNQLFAGSFNLNSRMQRASEYEIALNGAGGEIYRDEWKWDFNTTSIYKLIENSYNTGELGLFGINQKAFFENIEFKLSNQLKSFGLTKKNISRQEAEMVFPIYRSNFYYQGNNINNYFGTATLPFMSQQVILQSLSIPYNFKRSGRFEADLIKLINPVLASYNSEYGFSFKDGPSLKAKFKEWGYAKLSPPVKARVKAFLGSSNKSIFKNSSENNVYLSREVVQKLINPDRLSLSETIPNIADIKNQTVLNRIFSLELIAQQYLN